MKFRKQLILISVGILLIAAMAPSHARGGVYGNVGYNDYPWSILVGYNDYDRGHGYGHHYKHKKHHYKHRKHHYKRHNKRHRDYGHRDRHYVRHDRHRGRDGGRRDRR